MQPFNDEPYQQMNWGRGDIMNKTRNFKTDASGWDLPKRATSKLTLQVMIKSTDCFSGKKHPSADYRYFFRTTTISGFGKKGPSAGAVVYGNPPVPVPPVPAKLHLDQD
jgi:hypothetical protein